MNLRKGIEDLLKQADEEEIEVKVEDKEEEKEPEEEETEEVEEKTEIEEKAEEKPEEKDYKAILDEPGMRDFIRETYGQELYDKIYEVKEESKEKTEDGELEAGD